MTETLVVDQDRLWQSHMDMGKIGALPNGGNCRLTLTDEDKAGRELFINWCKEAGCEVTFDRVGNIFARRPGKENNKSAVMCGSHLDTQPHGGKFDGIYGVLAGLEVIRTLNDQGVDTIAPIEVAVWINEEGVRFPPGLTGSGAFAGVYGVDEVLSIRSRDGCLWGEELERIGHAGKEKPGSRDIDMFFEIHIEQGPILENQEKVIGVVTGIQGIRWFEVTVTGKDAHAGTTPLDLRKDALLAASQMVTAVNEIGQPYMPEIRMTVGRMEVSPNGPSTIPGEVYFTVDTRHPDDGVLARIQETIYSRFNEIAGNTGVALFIKPTIRTDPVIFHPECVTRVRNAVTKLGYSHMDILSGAGHDSIYLSRVAPTSMIFVPSQDGLSHNEAEYSSPEDLAAGCNVLLHAMLEQAGKA